MPEENKPEEPKTENKTSSADDRVPEILGAGKNDPNTPSDTGDLKWTGGSFSPKAFRFRMICLALLTAVFLFVGFHFVGVHCNALGQYLAWGGCIGVPVLLWVWLLAVLFYYRLTMKYQLDHERLLVRRGLFYQTTDTILIAQINDIKLVQTLWDKWVNGGVGTLMIYSSDSSDPQVFLRGIDRPKDAFDSLDHLRKDYVRRRGIKSFGVYGTDNNDDGGSSVGFF